MVETSVIVPIIILIAAATVIFAVFMLDMAKTKGYAMCAVKEKEGTEEHQLQSEMSFARVISQKVEKGAEKMVAEVTVTAGQLWSGISQYMAATYTFHTNTCSYTDHRKEIMWLKE